MIVKVALSVPPNYMFDYNTSDNIQLFDRVVVPVGNRKLIGFVVEKDVSIDYPVSKVKSIVSVLDSPVGVKVQSLINWISNYYCCDMYSAIKLALPNDYFKQEVVHPHKDIFVNVDQDVLSNYKPTKKQAELLDKVGDDTLTLDNLKSIGSVSIINKLFEKNVLVKSFKLSKVKTTTRVSDQAKSLNDDQKSALDDICKQSGFHASLIYGVTGSGKTEVYLQAIDKYIQESKQVLVLIPEINLTPQTVDRFEQRFADKTIAVLHSKLTEKDRLTNWFNIKSGAADIVISTRSGVLADFHNLGMIVVDEEHDSSFKQQTSTIRYNARDIAIFRGRELDIPVLLGSATPSIESYHNAKVGRYKLLKLKNKALNSFRNEIRLLDLKSTIVKNGVSTQLFKMLEENINAHNQSLVFVNKLGYAKALVCKSCATSVECKRCDKPYTLHSKPYQYLACHYCGTRKPLAISCGSCDHGELFTYGVGTERLQSQIEEKFPYNKVLRFDRSSIKNMQDLDDANSMINSNMVDIIVGTQMIAKGHHFERITLVGLINVDAGLYSSDFHAMEKTAQLIVQVSGRAGRADKPGVILLQTYQPENRLLQLLVSSDYLEFLDYLLEQRKFANYPPYSYQAQIIAESKKEADVVSMMNQIYDKIVTCKGVLISGPMPAMHLKKNNTYKYSLLITSKSRSQINSLMKWVRIHAPQQNDIKISFDIDPTELA